tara:strand:+ start:320 stop:838 length:519 start_codon:yes stop_codon:yes gene_type:complete
VTTQNPNEHGDDVTPEQLKELYARRDALREALNQSHVPHIEIQIVDDIQDKYTPIVETALTFEMLINSLLGNYTMANNQNSLALLFYITGQLHNISHLSADLLMQWIKQHLDLFGGSNPIENILKMLDRTEKPESEEVEDWVKGEDTFTEIPDVFKDALKEILENDNNNTNT